MPGLKKWIFIPPRLSGLLFFFLPILIHNFSFSPLDFFTVIYPDREKNPLLELNPDVMPFIFLELNSELFHIFSVTTQRKKTPKGTVQLWSLVK